MAQIIINSYFGRTEPFGHIDFTLIGDDGTKHTWGLNADVANPDIHDYRVEVEDKLLATTQHFSSAPITISNDAYNNINNVVNNDALGHSVESNYFIVGHNCVDYTQHILNDAGLNVYVSQFVAGASTPATAYARAYAGLDAHLPIVTEAIDAAGKTLGPRARLLIRRVMPWLRAYN